MKSRKRSRRLKVKFIILLFVLLFLIAFNIWKAIFAFSPSTTIYTVSPNVYFGFPPYGTEINFSTTQSFSVLDVDNDTWFWQFDDYKFQIQNGSMIVTDFFTPYDTGFFGVQTTYRLSLTIFGETGNTSTTQIYTAGLGKPSSITPESADGGYNETTGIQTITVTFESASDPILDWVVGMSIVMVESVQAAAQLFIVVLIIGLVRISGVTKDQIMNKVLTGIVAVLVMLIVTLVLIAAFFS